MASPRPLRTYDEPDSEGVARVYDFFEAHAKAGNERPVHRYLLVGAEPGEQVEIPEGVYLALKEVVDTLKQGRAVSITPVDRALSTQHAADLLGVSRPTLIKYLDAGELEYEKVGTHRRVRLDDVLAFRHRRREAQYAALAASAELGQPYDSPENTDALKATRRAVAARRHAGTRDPL